MKRSHAETYKNVFHFGNQNSKNLICVCVCVCVCDYLQSHRITMTCILNVPNSLFIHPSRFFCVKRFNPELNTIIHLRT